MIFFTLKAYFRKANYTIPLKDAVKYIILYD
jgi:hypothetical protein